MVEMENVPIRTDDNSADPTFCVRALVQQFVGQRARTLCFPDHSVQLGMRLRGEAPQIMNRQRQDRFRECVFQLFVHRILTVSE